MATSGEGLALDADAFEGLLFLEPREEYDRCVIGVVERFNDRFVLYSKECVIAATAAMSGVPDALDLAAEHYSYNMRGAFVGEHTPGFLEDNDE